MATGVSLSQLDHFCPSAIELASSVGCLGYQNTSLERKDMINLRKVSYTCAQSKINSIHLFIDDHILSIFYHHLFFFFCTQQGLCTTYTWILGVSPMLNYLLFWAKPQKCL